MTAFSSYGKVAPPTNNQIIMMLRFFRCLPLTGLLVLQACTFTNSRESDSSPTQALLEAQSATLENQAQTLALLSDNQQALLTELRVTQAQIRDLQMGAPAAASEPEAVGEVKPVAELLAQTEPGRKVRTNSSAKLLLGRVEWVWMDILSAHLKARIDTGVANASLVVATVQQFERNGESWVRFMLHDQAEPVEAPLKKNARRNRVALMVRMGSLAEYVDFALEQESEAPTYSVTLGRDFLQDIALVDVSRKFTQPKVELTLDQN
ncbi:RimK/LysX family protein [Teredinibacter turnerae]|uniref:putative ATP-dependent zinc protease n=1 Tax=Teredinibacter turnerae TaxID=2426 RepID=UPI0003782575|nr:RimK/LysX family protein [Teredinibacter turnerae]